MSARTYACWISLSILLGFVLFVEGEHFYLPKENNIFSNDLQDDWVPISGIDKRSTRNNHGFTQVVHITPPIRYPNTPVNQQSAASNKVEVFAPPPPTILGSFSEFGHSTIEAREPAHTLNFRPSYNFDRHYEEITDRRFQQNDYNEPEDQKPPAIVVFNAQQRHPQQNYQKPPPPPPPPQFYQNFQYHSLNPIGNNQNQNLNHNNNNNNNNNHNNNINNHKNFGYKELSTVQEPPKRLTPYFVPNDHIFPRPQGNNKQAVYAEQRPKPYLVNPTEPIPLQQQQQQQPQQQHQQQQQQLQQQQYKTSTEGGSSGYFQKYPGHVENQKLYPQISNFARPFEQTRDQNVFIKPNQYVHNLNVGTEVRFGQEVGATRPVSVDLSTGFTHPATRPFSKYQTPTPKNEELYRIFPVKEVNALPSFLPTPVTLGHQAAPKAPYFKEPSGGSSEYDAHEEQDENESSEQYDILRSPTKPMMTTTTTSTTVAPKMTRKRRPMTTTSTTTTTTASPEEYDEYAVPNRQQLQLQEQPQDYRPQHQYQQHHHQQQQEYDVTTTTEAATNYAIVEERPVPPVSVNKYKKKKPAPLSRPKEQPQPSVEDVEYVPERATTAPSPTTTTTTTTTTAVPMTTTTTTTTATAVDARLKTKAKYGNGTRPRFSIKDYRTTTASTTTTEKATGRRTTSTTTPAAPATDAAETAAVDQPTATVRKTYKPRARPNRYKQATATTTTSTTEEPQQQQETATEPPRAVYRSKYKPGKYYNRLRTSTEPAATVVPDGEQVAATEPTRPAVYSAKRRTVPTSRTNVDESNALRRSSSATPPNEKTSDAMDAASSEDVDYVATTVAVTPSATSSPPRHKFHTSYAADRPLLPIESFFQSSMAGKRYHNNERR